MMVFNISLMIIILILVSLSLKLKLEIIRVEAVNSITEDMYKEERDLYREAFNSTNLELMELKSASEKEVYEKIKSKYILRSELTTKANTIIKLENQTRQQNNHICDQANYIRELEAKILRLV